MYVQAKLRAVGRIGRLSVRGGQRLVESGPEGLLSAGGSVTANARRVYSARWWSLEVVRVTGSMHWHARQQECSRAAFAAAAVASDWFRLARSCAEKHAPQLGREFCDSRFLRFASLSAAADFVGRRSTACDRVKYAISVRNYRCSTSSVEGFVQQLACCYLRHGYWHYVMGKVPDWKDPATVDQKLIAKYDIAISESTRRRRKKLGFANLQYLRYQRLFIIIATAGKHRFREIEAGAVRDIRRVPIKIWGYSVSYRPGGRTRTGERDPRWHSHVEIQRERYKEIRDHLLDIAIHRSAESLALEFYHLPFEPYAPIRRQMLNIWRAVNRQRKAAGYSLLPVSVLPLRRRIVQPFGMAYRELQPDETPHMASGVVSPETGPSATAPPNDAFMEPGQSPEGGIEAGEEDPL